ncbi:MAG: hypothetical protein KAX37_09480, partial [Opitutaceae bacterium]|nr:hypothetical protein [Opitutaceae bacterium]
MLQNLPLAIQAHRSLGFEHQERVQLTGSPQRTDSDDYRKIVRQPGQTPDLLMPGQRATQAAAMSWSDGIRK